VRSEVVGIVMYNCTTSEPARVPELVMVTDAVRLRSLAETAGLEISRLE